MILRPFVLTVCVALAAAPAAAAVDGCSADLFAVDGTSVALDICPAPKNAVVEKVSVKGQPALVREVTLDRVPGADTSRAIDDVPLAKLGLARTLHLTIALRGGAVRLEHALLVPGAVPLR